jgi:DNA polymerase-4
MHARQDKAALSEIFTSLCMRVADDLQRKGYASRTIGIKLRYSDFHSVTRDVTLPNAVSDGVQIRKAAGECLRRVPLSQKIRLLGVRASGLQGLDQASIHEPGHQAELAF